MAQTQTVTQTASSERRGPDATEAPIDKTPVKIQDLSGRNLTINKDGSISFNTQSLSADSPIKYSVFNKETNTWEEETRIDQASRENKLNEKSGYDIEVTNSTVNPNNKNVYLTIGKDTEKFRIEIDGRVFVIDRADIKEFGDRSSKVVQLQVDQTPALKSRDSRIPTNPSSKPLIPGLDDLKIDKHGQIKFSVTTTHNDMLLHYARKDGSRSSSGYGARFRGGYGPGAREGNGIRMLGAYHEDRTFSLNVNHLNSKTVKVDFVLDNNLVSANLRIGGKTYNINVADLKRKIEAQSITLPPASAGSQAPESLKRANPTNPPSPAPSPSDAINPIITQPTFIPPTSEEGKSLVESASKDQAGENARNTTKGAVAVGAVAARNQAQQVEVRNSKGRSVTQKTVELETKLGAIEGKTFADDAARLEALKELNSKAQRTEFKAVDTEVKRLKAELSQMKDTGSSEYQQKQAEINNVEALKSRWLRQKVRINSELSNSSDPKVSKQARSNLYSLKSSGIKALDRLISCSNDPVEKNRLEAEKTALSDLKSRGVLRSLIDASGNAVEYVRSKVPEYSAIKSRLTDVVSRTSGLGQTLRHPVETYRNWVAARAINSPETGEGTPEQTNPPSAASETKPPIDEGPKKTRQVSDLERVARERLATANEQLNSATEGEKAIAEKRVAYRELGLRRVQIEDAIKGGNTREAVEKNLIETLNNEVKAASELQTELRAQNSTNPEIELIEIEKIGAQVKQEINKLRSAYKEGTTVDQRAEGSRNLKGYIEDINLEVNADQSLSEKVKNELKKAVEVLNEELRACENNKKPAVRELSKVVAEQKVQNVPEKGATNIEHKASEALLEIAKEQFAEAQKQVGKLAQDAPPAMKILILGNKDLAAHRLKIAECQEIILNPESSTQAIENASNFLNDPNTKLTEINLLKKSVFRLNKILESPKPLVTEFRLQLRGMISDYNAQIEKLSHSQHSYLDNIKSQCIDATWQRELASSRYGSREYRNVEETINRTRVPEGNAQALEISDRVLNANLKLAKCMEILNDGNVGKVFQDHGRAEVKKLFNNLVQDVRHSSRNLPESVLEIIDAYISEVISVEYELSDAKNNKSALDRILEVTKQLKSSSINSAFRENIANLEADIKGLASEGSQNRISDRRAISPENPRIFERARVVVEPKSRGLILRDGVLTSENPTEGTIAEVDQEPRGEFNLKDLAAEDKRLEKAEKKLANKKSPTPENLVELSDIQQKRARVALEVKAGIEAQIASLEATDSSGEIRDLRSKLHLDWAERIAKALDGPEQLKFEAESAKFHLNHNLENGKFRSSEVKAAKKVCDKAKAEINRLGDAASEMQKSELRFREAELGRLKIEEILGRPNLTDFQKAELEAQRRLYLNEQHKTCTDLKAQLDVKLNADDTQVKEKVKLRKTISQLEFDLQVLESSLNTNYEPQYDQRAAQVEADYYEALDGLEEANRKYSETQTPEAEKAIKEAQVKVDKADLERATYEKELKELDIRVRETFLNDQKAKLQNVDTPKEVKAVINDNLEPTEKEITSQKLQLESLEATEKSKSNKLKVSEASLELHSLENAPNRAPADIESKKANLENLKAEYDTFEAERRNRVQDVAENARVEAKNSIKSTIKNPLAQLAAITIVNEAINAALDADLDPEASHTYCPRVLFAWNLEGYLNTYQTTKELGTTSSRAADIFSRTTDTAVQFGGIIVAFHLATGKTKSLPAIYNSTLGKTALGNTVGKATGGLFHKMGNPGIVLLATGEIGYHSVADGKFIGRDGIGYDALTLGMPTASTLIMGSTMLGENSVLAGSAKGLITRIFGQSAARGSWAGPVGVGVTAAVQLGSTWYGIDSALENLDKECNGSVVKKGVNRSIDLALMKGFYVDNASNVPWTVSEPTKEQVAAIDDRGMVDFYNHLMRSAIGESSEGKLPSFRGKTYSLNSYSIEELSALNLAVRGNIDLNADQFQKHNFGVVHSFYSEEENHGAGGYPLVGTPARWVGMGSTALEAISDPTLRRKVEADISSIRDWYLEVYRHSLKFEYTATDNMGTDSIFWSNYRSAGLSESYNSDGRLNSSMEIKNRMQEYANHLSSTQEFQDEVLTVIGPERNNLFEALEYLTPYYPEVDRMLSTEEGYKLFISSFVKKEINQFSGKMQETGELHELGESFGEFRSYAKSLEENSDFQNFIQQIEASPEVLFSSPKLEEFFPGISKYLSLEMQVEGSGMGVIQSMIGKEHPLCTVINDYLKEHRKPFVELELDVERAGSNLETLTNHIDKYPDQFKREESNFFQLDPFNVEKNNDGSGLVDPAAIRIKGYGYAFVRSFNSLSSDGSKKIAQPGILVINEKDLENSDDIIIRKAAETLKGSITKTGKLSLNSQVFQVKNEGGIDFYGCNVRSDGSIIVSGHDRNRVTPFTYSVSPSYVRDAKGGMKIEWRKTAVRHENSGYVAGLEN